MDNLDGDGHSGHCGGDGEVADSNYGYGMLVVLVVMVRLGTVTMVMVLW